MSEAVSAEQATSTLTALPSKGLAGDVAAPPDKSISHRALILSALAQGETRIENLLESDDVLRTAAALRAFGVDARRETEGLWRVRGGEWRSPAEAVDCGNSGTAARLLMGAAAGFELEAVFDGDRSLRRRPMRRVTGPLAAMGARFEGSDTLPLRLQGGGLRGISWRNAPASAQVKSAILLAGLRSQGHVEILEPAPSRDHSEIMLRAFGCDVATERRAEGRLVSLGERRTLYATELSVPGDPSSAAFPIVAALITPGSDIIVRGVLLNPLRTGLLSTLLEMGAKLDIVGERECGGEFVGDVRARTSDLRGVEVPAERAPSMIDEYPVLAAAAACASGPTIMHGLGELRHKESDRLHALARGLADCGIACHEEAASLTIAPSGRPAGGGMVATEGDHRIAMAFLVLGLASRSGITVDEPEMIVTSFPGFAGLMSGLGARIGPS